MEYRREHSGRSEGGVLDEVLREVAGVLATELLQDLLELFLENLHNLIATFVTHRANAKHRGTAEKREFGTGGHGDGDVGA